MRVDIVEAPARERMLHRFIPVGEVRERGLAAQLAADEAAQAFEEPRFGVGQEDRERGGMAVRGRGAVFRVERVGDRVGDPGEGRIPGLRGEPRLPRLPHAPVLAERGGAPVAEAAFVHEREAREGGLVGEGATGVRIDVREEVARPRAEVREGRLVEGAEDLVPAPRDRPVAVEADRAPGNRVGPRDVEVGREVEAVLHAGGDEEVELVHLRGLGLRAIRAIVRETVRGDHPSLVVVEADGVVADASEVGGETLRLLRGVREVRRVAEVHAVEALRDTREALELEVPAAHDDAPEFPGGRVVRNDGQEVERRAGLDPGFVGERNPVGPGDDADGRGILRLGGAGRKHGEERGENEEAKDSAGCFRWGFHLSGRAFAVPTLR